MKYLFCLIFISTVILSNSFSQSCSPSPSCSSSVSKHQKVIIKEVIPNSPAEDAKLLSGDHIVLIDDSPITSIRMVEKILNNGKAGNFLKLQILRQEEALEIRVKLSDRKSVQLENNACSTNEDAAFLGVILTNGNACNSNSGSNENVCIPKTN